MDEVNGSRSCKFAENRTICISDLRCIRRKYSAAYKSAECEPFGTSVFRQRLPQRNAMR